MISSLDPRWGTTSSIELDSTNINRLHTVSASYLTMAVKKDRKAEELHHGGN